MAFFDELTKKAQLVAGAAAEKAKDLAETATELRYWPPRRPRLPPTPPR